MTDHGKSPSRPGWPADSRTPAPAKIAEVRQFAPAYPVIGIRPDDLDRAAVAVVVAHDGIHSHHNLHLSTIQYDHVQLEFVWVLLLLSPLSSSQKA